MIGLSLEEQIQKLKAEEERSILAWNSKPGSFQSTLLKQEQDRWARTPPEALRYEIGEELKVQEALAMVATISGGWTMFLEQPSQADEIYSRIFSDITRRYVLGYYWLLSD